LLTYTLDATKIPNGKLTFKVNATNIKGTGDFSTAVEILSADKPSAPAGLTAVVDKNKAGITLAWTAAVNNGSPVTGHSFSTTIGKAAAVITTATTAEVTTNMKAEAGSSYSFMVAATNLKGTGDYSTAAVVEVPSNVSVVQGTV